MSAQEGKGPRPFDALEIGLFRPRDELFEIIDRRIDGQIGRGLIQEVLDLLASGVPTTAAGMTSIGYRQLLPYLDGTVSLDAALERIRFDTHRYVRHQETWLRKNPRLVRFEVSAEGWRERAMATVAAFLDRGERHLSDPILT